MVDCSASLLKILLLLGDHFYGSCSSQHDELDRNAGSFVGGYYIVLCVYFCLYQVHNNDNTVSTQPAI